MWFIGVISVIEKPPYYECEDHFCAADNDEDDGSVEDCAKEVIKFAAKWKKAILKVMKCTVKETILTSLCEWLSASGDLVYRSITFDSLDNRLDTITADDFDRQYFPLIYGAQG